jgi:hypothetical protein
VTRNSTWYDRFNAFTETYDSLQHVWRFTFAKITSKVGSGLHPGLFSRWRGHHGSGDRWGRVRAGLGADLPVHPGDQGVQRRSGGQPHPRSGQAVLARLLDRSAANRPHVTEHADRATLATN